MARVFITFIELVLEGGWNEKTPENLVRVFEANGPSEIRVVEPEVIVRSFMFGTGGRAYVGNSVVSFDSSQVQDELSVDDKNRAVGGKRLRFE